MIDPNEPAFPSSGSDNPKLMGLTKREYFIAKAIEGTANTFGVTKDEVDSIVDNAEKIVDKLIKELNNDER